MSNVVKMLPGPGNMDIPLPNNIEAEQALLGAILLHNEVYLQVAPFLDPADFYERTHQQVYDLISHFIPSGRIATPITLAGSVGEIEGLGMSPGEYLAMLCSEATTTRNAVEYGKVVKDLSIQRSVYLLCGEFQQQILTRDNREPPVTMIDRFESELSALRPAHKGGQGQFQSFAAAADRAVFLAQASFQKGAVLSGLSTGLTGVDNQLGGLQNSDLIVVAGRTSMGKQQSVDAIVYTPAGPKRIGDIRVGDMVLGGDGRPVQVTGVYPQGVKPSYRVWFADGSSTECGPDHLWAAKTEKDRLKRKDWRVVSLRQMLDHGISTKKKCGRTTYKWSIPLCGPAEFSGRPGMIPPYMLGVLIGDGALTCGVVFSTPDIDIDIAQRVTAQAEAMGYRVSRSVALPPACPQYRVAVDIGHRNPLRKWIREAELEVLSAQKFIPREYLLADVESRRELLSGLMDTDGSASRGYATFSTTSLQLALDMQFLVRSLGGQCRVNPQDRTHHGKGVEYNMTAMLPFNPFKSKRKAAQWREPDAGFMKQSIRKIEQDGMKEQVCIQVARADGLYLTDDFIVTHNTALAVNIATTVALDLREKRINGEKTGVVAFFTLEMSADQLASRVISEHSRVSSQRVRKGQISEAQMTDFALAAERLHNLPIQMDATGNIQLASLMMRARNLHKKVGVELIVVDYIQLIRVAQRGRESNRAQEVTEITASLKSLAKELDCPVIALSQLSRDIEKREEKRPMLSDLSASGSIENDADVVMFVYRDEYYLARQEPKAGTDRHNDWTTAMEKARGRAEIIVGKNRHGPIGTVHVGFNANLTQFNNELPESILDNATPREKREAKKVRRFLKESGPALQDLRTLVLTSSLENDGHVDAAKNHKIVPYTLWKKKVAASLLDPEATEAQKVKLMKDVVADLKTDPPLIGRGGSESESFVWLIS